MKHDPSRPAFPPYFDDELCLIWLEAWFEEKMRPLSRRWNKTKTKIVHLRKRFESTMRGLP